MLRNYPIKKGASGAVKAPIASSPASLPGVVFWVSSTTSDTDISQNRLHVFASWLESKTYKAIFSTLVNQLQIPIVNEFLNVFLDDLPGVPMDREIEFGIDLVTKTHPISIPPYRMSSTELRELKEQLEDHLDKGFIHPNEIVKLHGVPILIISNSDRLAIRKDYSDIGLYASVIMIDYGGYWVEHLPWDPKFQLEMSSIYQSVKCDKDVLSFGNLSDLGPQRAIFGCEIAETGDPYNQRADGIMGLGRRDVIIVDQLVEKHLISDSFTLCYVGFDGGVMVLVSDGNNPYYNIELKEILVPGKPLKMNPWVFGGKHGAILDSGTTYAYLPEPVFIAFNSINSFPPPPSPTTPVVSSLDNRNTTAHMSPSPAPSEPPV
ncbi:putative aspartic proteinase-like protein 2-like isoform X2 [Capsicum annuum]|nr:putative aspartic proteinase-like protein 2-like isoform X2 [Capsicum annuum]